MFPDNWANFGCGPDLKASDEKRKWYNFDSVLQHRNDKADWDKEFHIWDMTESPERQLEHDYTERFDGGVINHVLCTMNDYSAHKALINIHRMMKPGATLTVIDMDLLKVFKSYQDGRSEDIPIEEGSIDDKLCFAISGYGTRKSLYTPERMMKVLTEAGFRIIIRKEESEFDTRPKESLIFEAIK